MTSLCLLLFGDSGSIPSYTYTSFDRTQLFFQLFSPTSRSPLFSLNCRDTWSSSASIYRNSTAFFSGFSSSGCGNVSLCSLFLTVCQACFFPCFPVCGLNRLLQQFCFSVFCQPFMAFYPHDPIQQISAFSGLFVPEQGLFKTNGSKTGCQFFPSVLTTSQNCFLFALSRSIWLQSSNVSFMRSNPRAITSSRIP